MRGNARDLNLHKLPLLNLKKILVRAQILLLSANSTMTLCVGRMEKLTTINVISTERLMTAYVILHEDRWDDLSLLHMEAPVWLSQSDLMMPVMCVREYSAQFVRLMDGLTPMLVK